MILVTAKALLKTQGRLYKVLKVIMTYLMCFNYNKLVPVC